MPTWAQLRDVLWEDDAALVLNKPAGWSVMGERHDTDLVRLARDAGEELFPVHRIDKVTSGAVLFAKQLRHHGDLTRQFTLRTVEKAYLAITCSTGLPDRGTIDLPLSTGRKSRVRVAAPRERIVVGSGADGAGHWTVEQTDVFTHVSTYPSVTRFVTAWRGSRHSLLVVHPVTGRRHQIRVHLAWIGHRIDGDPLFDKHATGRTLLHSWALGFDAAWLGGRRVDVRATPDEEFWSPVRGELPDGPEALLTVAARAAAHS